MPFNNKIGILVNAPLFERELRKHFSRRCDYQKLLEFLTSDEEENMFNRDGRVNDCVRALYFHALTVFRNNRFEERGGDNYKSFLGALKAMGYEPVSAYNSIDSQFVLKAIELADLGIVDTIFLMGVTVDHVDLIWHLKSKGIRVVGFFANVYDASERIKSAVNWYYQIKNEDSFLGDKVQQAAVHDDEEHHETESREPAPITQDQ